VDGYMVGFMVLIVGWSSWYKAGWTQECAAVGLRWGTRGFEEEEKNRPQFFGDEEGPLRRSEVTGDRELYYPDDKRWWIVSGNLVLVVLVVLLNMGLFAAIFYAEVLVYTQYTEWLFPMFDWAVAFFIAVMIEVCSSYYVEFAEMLNDNENHQTQTNYEDALIMKILIFKIINHNIALMFVAFIKVPAMPSCHRSMSSQCRRYAPSLRRSL
jgi:hypothetical protein